MSSMPARKLGLNNRGIINENMAADIVIFHPETIRDRATYSNPHQYPEGIHYVIVNGKVVLEGETHTGILVGKIEKKMICRSKKE